MIAFDTSFLLDYLDGVPATREFLDAREDSPFFAPSLCLFEVYRGGARTGGPERVETVASSLDWIEPLELTDGAAREAALVEAELLDSGEPINLGDVLVAGICRHNDAELVTRDGDFDRVEGLETLTY